MQPTAKFDAPKLARSLLRCSRQGALATLMADGGAPYCSLVNVASDVDGAPILLISRLAVHTKNVLADDRVSLMLDERREGDPMEGARIMLLGRARMADDDNRARLRRRYLNAQPEAESYADFADFSFFRVEPSGTHLVAGFGRIVDLQPEQFLIPTADAPAMIDAEQSAIDHMNADHRDALRLYATRLLNGPEAEWRCAGCDPEGLDLQAGRITLRLLFPKRATTPGELRKMLAQLADEARSK